MMGFRTRLRTAIKNSKYKNSYRRLSKEAGLGERTISNLLTNTDVDSSRVGPGLFAMTRVANLLGVSLDHLAGRDSVHLTLADGDAGLATTLERLANAARRQVLNINRSTTPQAMQRIFVKSGGRIEAFSPYLIHCDRYFPIYEGAECIQVKEVGQESLAAITMGISCTETLQTALSTVDDDNLRRKLVCDHLDTMKRGCLSTVENLNIRMPNLPIVVRMDYIRILMHLADADGNTEIVSYSSLIV